MMPHRRCHLPLELHSRINIFKPPTRLIMFAINIQRIQPPVNLFNSKEFIEHGLKFVEQPDHVSLEIIWAWKYKRCPMSFARK